MHGQELSYGFLYEKRGGSPYFKAAFQESFLTPQKWENIKSNFTVARNEIHIDKHEHDQDEKKQLNRGL